MIHQPEIFIFIMTIDLLDVFYTRWSMVMQLQNSADHFGNMIKCGIFKL